MQTAPSYPPGYNNAYQYQYPYGYPATYGYQVMICPLIIKELFSLATKCVIFTTLLFSIECTCRASWGSRVSTSGRRLDPSPYSSSNAAWLSANSSSACPHAEPRAETRRYVFQSDQLNLPLLRVLRECCECRFYFFFAVFTFNVSMTLKDCWFTDGKLFQK